MKQIILLMLSISVVFGATNIAPNGTAYRWYSMATPTDDILKVATPALNDGVTNYDIDLFDGLSDSSEDVTNAYEAGGVLWTSLQHVSEFQWINGTRNNYDDGVFTRNFQIQATTNGTTWYKLTNWTCSPAYGYNWSTASGTIYTWSGKAQNVLGIRCVGQVATAGDVATNSYVCFCDEVLAFGMTSAPPGPPRTNVQTLSWYYPTNALFDVHESSDLINWNLFLSQTTLTNTLITETNAHQFFYAKAYPQIGGGTTHTNGSATIEFAWNASTDPTVVGYNFYYGVASRTYTNMINVGSATTLTVSNLFDGVTYYFAVTDYNAAGLESDYSTELVYTVPYPTNNPPVYATVPVNAPIWLH